jgi:hypothetical protein
VDVIASRAISVQWLVHERQIRAVNRTHVKQRGSRKKPDVATVSPPEGYLGVNRRQRQRQNENDQTLGNSPRRRRQADIDIMHVLELKCTTLSISRPALFFSRPFRVSNQPNIARFSPFLFSYKIVPWANIYVTKYHQNPLLQLTSKSDSHLYFFMTTNDLLSLLTPYTIDLTMKK